MFYVAEDVIPAVKAAEGVFGKSGNMIHNAWKMNVSLATKKFGKIWYGDIDMTPAEFDEKCSGLAKTLGSLLFVLENDEYDFDVTKKVYNNLTV